MTRRDERIERVRPAHSRTHLAARLLSIAFGIADLTGQSVTADVASEICNLTKPGRRNDLHAFLDRLEGVLKALERETNLAERQDA